MVKDSGQPQGATNEQGAKGGWFQRLRTGLQKTSTQLTGGIRAALSRGRLDQDALTALEETLIGADMGPTLAARLTHNLSKRSFDRGVHEETVRLALAEDIGAVLRPYAQGIPLDLGRKPFVLLFVGVNGSGKTTTIGKLAAKWAGEGRSVRIAACDTFRAAATDQLSLWADRAGVPITKGAEGADPAGLAYDALRTALDEKEDILMIDTAGRLHNRENLMAELAKTSRVLQKIKEDAPNGVILVLDGTIGQNAYSQVEAFQKCVPLSGIIVTKLDGTARGGVIVGLAEKFSLPIYAVGVGEGADDLRSFDGDVFARQLLGLGDSQNPCPEQRGQE